MILWHGAFETGSEIIDQQHRMLINNINHLGGMLTNTNPTREECEFILHLINFLETYADTHFKVEEQCMERFRCPAHAQNKLAHEQFRSFFLQFKERFKTEGFKPELLRQLHDAINLWIEEHILQIDLQLRPCLKK